MRARPIALLLAAVLCLVVHAHEAATIVPTPVQLIEGTGTCKLDTVTVDCRDAALLPAAQYLAQSLAGRATVAATGGRATPVKLALDTTLEASQYRLDIAPGHIDITGGDYSGVACGIATLRQLLPAAAGSIEVPCLRITDKPRYGWRGLLLDSSRHFWSVDEVKRLLDLMACYKLNRLHWHLTDDQGWRIEIKSYPRLTEVGAWRDGTCIGKDFESNDGIRYGGFYTQEQLREIVDYAAARGIEVIPEVDLPGHMVAALAAYPELGCTGGPYKVWPRWGIAPDILCAGNDKVFDFLESVLSEVIDIFPSEYIHIGGDECFDPYAKNTVYPWDVCPKCAARMRKLGIKKGPEAKHLLQSYVTARVQKFVNSKGRRIIGWDEILEGELAEGATVMSWRGVDGGIKAASLGFDAIMTPHTYAYFDYYQSKERDKEPLCIGGYLPLENVYAYEPFDGLAPGAEDHILGVQANLWTEYITTPEHLEYMLLPRMCALSEIQWCDADKKDYSRFCKSLDHTFEILDAMGVNYCLDYKGQIGLDRQPARDSVALAEYLEAAKSTWGW